MDVRGKSNFLMNTLLEEGLIPFSRAYYISYLFFFEGIYVTFKFCINANPV